MSDQLPPLDRKALEALAESLPSGVSDHLPMSVPLGTFIVPAHVVSGLGKGDTDSGMALLDHLFPMAVEQSMAPLGSQDIAISPGERAIPPEEVARYGNGDIEKGARRLSAFFGVALNRDGKAGRPKESRSAFGG